MKDLTVSVVGVVTLALAIGLVFHWAYPQVELSAELAGLFAFIALLLKLVVSKGWQLVRKQRTQAPTETSK